MHVSNTADNKKSTSVDTRGSMLLQVQKMSLGAKKPGKKTITSQENVKFFCLVKN